MSDPFNRNHLNDNYYSSDGNQNNIQDMNQFQPQMRPQFVPNTDMSYTYNQYNSQSIGQMTDNFYRRTESPYFNQNGSQSGGQYRVQHIDYMSERQPLNPPIIPLNRFPDNGQHFGSFSNNFPLNSNPSTNQSPMTSQTGLLPPLNPYLNIRAYEQSIQNESLLSIPFTPPNQSMIRQRFESFPPQRSYPQNNTFNQNIIHSSQQLSHSDPKPIPQPVPPPTQSLTQTVPQMVNQTSNQRTSQLNSVIELKSDLQSEQKEEENRIKGIEGIASEGMQTRIQNDLNPPIIPLNRFPNNSQHLGSFSNNFPLNSNPSPNQSPMRPQTGLLPNPCIPPNQSMIRQRFESFPPQISYPQNNTFNQNISHSSQQLSHSDPKPMPPPVPPPTQSFTQNVNLKNTQKIERQMDDKNEKNESPIAGHSSDLPLDEDDETITMLDVLREEQDLEENAFAVLGGSDDKNCTYLKGYVSRQPLYSCKTCELTSTSESECNPRAAICLGCSYRCHDGHDLIELYTKRNLRCDCGTDLFVDNKCKLFSKTSRNDKNQYNHNFDGLYCVCLRPYPDPDFDSDDTMIQCVVCEDWFHGRHLENTPEDEDFSELICKSCMNRLPFLWYYYRMYEMNRNKIIDLSSIQLNKEKREKEKTEKEKTEKPVVSESDSGVETSSCDSTESLAKSSQCKLNELKNTYGEQPSELVSAFWPLEWRQRLCICKNCVQIYTDNKCLFLTDEKDSVHYYESQSRQTNIKVSHYDKGLTELNKMNRIQQIEYITEYNNLKNSLQEYLKKFAKNKKTVREEDIKEFFEEFRAKKRQKVDIPFNCK